MSSLDIRKTYKLSIGGAGGAGGEPAWSGGRPSEARPNAPLQRQPARSGGRPSEARPNAPLKKRSRNKKP